MEKLSSETKVILSKIANTVRALSIDAVQKANSGHPGLPLGCAELGAYLYGIALRDYPKNSEWINRDRMVLSAGHGSMWLYSLLHLSGFALSLEDLKQFRQMKSKTPGHPEFGVTDGVEATTGPLGQGAANAVGIALSGKILEQKFNRAPLSIFDFKVFCLVSDGDIMEGVCSEASSFAGHMQLDNLIFIYDANKVTLDGALSECASENTLERYRAYGWQVHEMDAYDFDKMHELFSHLRKHQEKPAFILMHSVIGRGSPNKAGTSAVHGAALGANEVAATKANLNLPQEEFFVPEEVSRYFENKILEKREAYESWQEKFHAWEKEHAELYEKLILMKKQSIPKDLEKKLSDLEIKSPMASRSSSHRVLQLLSSEVEGLYGGSADLSSSDMTKMEAFSTLSRRDFSGRNIKFGVREFAMAACANGMSYTKLFIPYIGTFLTFSDYMRNAIRLACLSKLHVIYQFTHDSIFLGEDGPTHQPVEHLASLRAMPNLHVIRPCDASEVKAAWLMALDYHSPTALILSRQPLKELNGTKVALKDGVGRGGYIIKRESSASPEYTLIATGSEVSLALDVAAALEKKGRQTRVISMPCTEIFDKQSAEYKESVLGGDIGRRVSIEASSDFGWHKYIGREGIAISVTTFGESAPAAILAEAFGFQVDQILERIL